MDRKEEKIKELEKRAQKLKQEVNYYNALQLGLKLVLNGSYGAFAAPFFILFNNEVAGTITAEGRQLTKTMSKVNEDYWYNQWHLDKHTHMKMGIKNINPILKNKSVSIYGDTDSIFVGFDEAIKSCEWKNNLFNNTFFNKYKKKYLILKKDENTKFDIDSENYKGTIIYDNSNHKTIFKYNDEEIEKLSDIDQDFETVLVCGNLIKDGAVDKFLEIDNIYSINNSNNKKVLYNWENELQFIHGMDKFKIEKFFKDELTKHADKYGVENIQDFELEKISESIINLEKKKYIQHIVWEEGIDYERLKYFQPKGVELVRSSTPMFARDPNMGIMRVVKYLFNDSENFNTKELIKIIKDMRKQFELANPNDISGQSSCSNYNTKVIDDKEKMSFVTGAHFAVKAAAYHNYLLHRNKELQNKYAFLKSGDKIKYYYTKSSQHNIFAFKRGEYPLEFAPEIDYETQFYKVILSPINSIVTKLGIPEINSRLNIIKDIFGNI